MRRWRAYLLAMLPLLAIWLLLTSLSFGQVLLALAVSLVGARAIETLGLPPPPLGLHRLAALLRLLPVVAVEILRSNYAVARLILTERWSDRRAGLASVPLSLRDRYGLTTLAIILTATPGTVWLGYDPGTGILKLHVFDDRGAAEMAAFIQRRYEHLLKEIFE
jgi:multicomponent K+:H+ antiporter subunit E